MKAFVKLLGLIGGILVLDLILPFAYLFSLGVKLWVYIHLRYQCRKIAKAKDTYYREVISQMTGVDFRQK